jgi:hypothetical protein
VTTEQDGTPGHGATSKRADDGDDAPDDGDDAQPAMASNAATTTSAVPGRAWSVIGWS